jgi:hypothetical protein
MLSVSVIGTDVMLPFSATSESAGQHSVESSPWPSNFDPSGVFGGGASWSNYLAQQDPSLEFMPDSDGSFTGSGSLSDEMSGHFGSMSLYSQRKGMQSSDMFLMDPSQHVSDSVSLWGSLNNVFSEAYLDKSRHIAEVCNIEISLRQTNLLYRFITNVDFLDLSRNDNVLDRVNAIPVLC